MDIADFIDTRLDAMLAHPLNWGGAEAFELQVLLLLELRQFLRSPVDPSTSLRSQVDAYTAFLRTVRPDVGPRPLSAVSDDTEVIAKYLDGFRMSLEAQEATASTDPAPAAPRTLGTDVEVSQSQPNMPRAA